MIRHPYVAGQFYPASATQLRAMIKKLVDEKAKKEEVIGLLMPHAGYPYSGPVAGAAISRVKFQDTFIIMGPSHSGLGKPFSIMTGGTWQTPLGDVEVDTELAEKVLASSQNLQADTLAHQQEHAVEVQLPFLQYFKPEIRIVPIILAHAGAETYQEIGQAIARAIKELGKEAALIASGDMTHYEPQEDAERKDAQAIEAIVSLDADELTRRYHELDISMCAYGPVVALITAARELGANKAELVKYQTSAATTGDYSAVVGYAGIIIKAGKMPPLTKLAKDTVETYVRDRKIPSPLQPLTPEMKEKAGVFVSIHRRGALRGCIGTFEPQQHNVAEEIITNAISSATQDPRFPPITPEELDELDYSVDVLTTPEPVADPSQLDPKKYGVIVEADWRRGLLLPDLEGVDTVDYQISICRQKAGIGPDEPVQLYRFEVKRYR
jgi:hypothetical protein